MDTEHTGKTGNHKNQKQVSKKRTLTKEERTKRRRRQVRIQRMGIAVMLMMAVLGGIALGKRMMNQKTVRTYQEAGTEHQKEEGRPDIDVQLLTVNPYSRPGIPTDPITAIVIHYIGNPGTTAQQNRDYFESLKDLQDVHMSSNFVIGLEGEIIQCVPTSEMAYASNSRNHDTVSIECCHPDETGKFNDATYQSAVELTAFLCRKFGLTEENVIRHHDVTGKDCPKYFVEHEDAWLRFREDVGRLLQ
jgi:N-acetylmuramoyl-L-alanine amidase